MPTTKSEEMSIQLKEIKDSIINLNTSLNSKMDEIKVAITNDLKNLEVSVFAEISELKQKNANLTILIDSMKSHYDTEIAKIEERLYSNDSAVSMNSNLISTVKKDYELQQNERIINLEKSVFTGLQHGRKWNFEIDGIPANIGDYPKQLEEATIKILNAINVDCNKNDIEAIHRLPSKMDCKPTIVRCKSRKMVEAAFLNKSKLKNLQALNINIVGLTAESKIYLRPSLCPYYKNLAYNCRVLKRNNLIAGVHISDEGTVKIKNFDNEFIKITHERDLISRFPSFVHFSFNTL